MIIKGTYAKDLTVSAEKDIIVNDDVDKRSGDVMLGMIANKFVRIYHPRQPRTRDHATSSSAPTNLPARRPTCNDRRGASSRCSTRSPSTTTSAATRSAR